MNEYLLSGIRSDGRRLADVVDAHSADDAIWQMESRGLSGIQLHTDELVAPFYKLRPLLKHFRPAELVRLRGTGVVEFSWLLSIALFRQMWFALLLAVASIGIRRMMEAPWGAWDVAPVLVAFAPALFGIFWGITSFRRPERRLLSAIGWARWEEADRILHREKLTLAPFELQLRKAQCLAGMGRLSEALMEFEELRELPEMNEQRYWTFKGIVFMAAKETRKALEAIANAFEADPNMSSVRIEYAARLIHVRKDHRNARNLLAGLGDRPIADLALPGKFAVEGLIEMAQGRTVEAAELLSESHKRIERFSRGNPSLLPALARVGAWRCQALAANGDAVAARKQLLQIAPILAANQEFDLLKECEQAVG